MVFLEDVAFAPLANGVDIQFGTLRADAPGDLEGRACLLAVFRARRRTDELNRCPCICWQAFGVLHCAKVQTALSNQGEDLSLDAQLGVAAVVG